MIGLEMAAKFTMEKYTKNSDNINIFPILYPDTTTGNYILYVFTYKFWKFISRMLLDFYSFIYKYL